MPTYDEPLRMTYSVNAAALDTAGEILNVAGPLGKQGRLVAVCVNVSVAITVAAGLLSIGSAGDIDLYGTLVTPVTAVDLVINNPTLLTTDDNLIAANAPVIVTCDGVSTAGDGTVTIVIDWF